MFFRITFLSPNIFSLISISHQYIDAHFGGNRLQLSFRVLEIYFLSVRSISGKTEDVYQHTDRLPTYFTRRTSTYDTYRDIIQKATCMFSRFRILWICPM